MIIYLSIIMTIILLSLICDCLINKINYNDDQDYALTKLVSVVIAVVSGIYFIIYGILSLIWWLVLNG